MTEEKTEKTQQERIDELSMEIFGKKAKDIKYLLVTNYIHHQLLDEELARTGLYQWLNVFNGEVKCPRDVLDYSKYDIVQVNMSKQDIGLVTDIRDELGPDSKTKLVLNNDYTTEMWGNTFEQPNVVGRETHGADMIFGTEYYMCTAMTEMTGRTCYVIPHPADIRRLKSLAPVPVRNVISTIWRRYDKNSLIPSFVARNHGLTTQLLGFDKNQEPRTWSVTPLYDYVFAGTNFFDFCDQLRESKVVYDPFTFHSYNRAMVDCAALGVPVVASDRTQSVNVCYPFTKVDPWDVKGAREMIDRLLTDEEFRQKVVNTARERSEFYNHENSCERYLMAIKKEQTDKWVADKKKKRKILEHGRGDDVNTLIAKGKNRENAKKN